MNLEPYRNTIILTSVVLYMAMCVLVGVWALRRTKSTRDFFMAGRSLGILVTGLAVFSSTLSGFGFVGGPGLVYRQGLSSIWMVICVTFGYSLSFFLLAKRIRMFAELRESISLPDVVAARYKSELSRFLTALAILLGVLGYLASQIKAMATVLKDILNSNSSVQGLLEAYSISDAALLEISVVLAGAVLVFYCVTGGIVASVYTDMVQGLVMMIAGALVFFATLSAWNSLSPAAGPDGTSPGLVDGATGIVRTIMVDDPEAISPWGTLGILGCLSWYFLFALGGAGQPHIITKMMMNRKISDARNILPICILGYGLSALLWISIGLAMRALVISGAHAPLMSADDAAPQFLSNYAHPLLAGVVFAGLFAAIMSTADGFLNIGAAAIVHDIPQSIRGMSLRRELLWARIGTVVLAALSSIMAVSSDDLVALLGAFGWGTFAAALVPAVAIGFNWKRANATAVNTAIISSLVINFGVKLTGLPTPYSMDAGAIALMISLILFFSISFLSRPRPIDPDVDAVMDL